MFNGYYICDNNDRGIVYLRGGALTTGDTTGFFGVKNHNADGADLGYKGILISRSKANATTITLDGPAIITDSVHVVDTITGDNGIISACVIP